MDLPQHTIQKQNESKSYAIALYYLRDIGIFRNVTEHDYGIDFEIEFVQKGKVTGKTLKVQVKSSDNLRIDSEGRACISGIKQTTLNYWCEISYNINVILLCVDLKTEKIYISAPLFNQITKLIDSSDNTKTIKTIPKANFKDINIVENVLLKTFFSLPAAREQTSLHINIIKNLKAYLALYGNVFHYDAGVSVDEDEDTFRDFLTSCKEFLYTLDVKKEFKDEQDSKNCYSSYYWGSKDGSMELCNYHCWEPMKILFPKLLEELIKQRNNILEAKIYWQYKNREFYNLIVKYFIPEIATHDSIIELSEQIDPFDKLNDLRIYNTQK